MALPGGRELIKDMAGFVQERHERMREIKRGGKKIIGYFCSYTPEELILAAGMHPVRIMADLPDPAGPVDAHLQNFACAFARSCLDQLVRDRLDYLDGIIFPCTCDSLRAVSEIIRANKKEGFFYHFLNMPLRVEGDPQFVFYRRELELLYNALAGFAGRPPGLESLKGAVALADANRELLIRIWDFRKASGPALTGEECLGIVNAAVCMDREELRERLEKIRNALAGGIGDEKDTGRARLMVIGSVIDNPALIRIIESAGALVVGDDLCTGARYFSVPVNMADGEDPLDALARRYLGRIPCPTKHPVDRRLDHINRVIDDFKIQGAVVVLQKFCEPHAFDYPALRDMITGRGIPVLLLEIEPGRLAEGQLSTRVEAFVEMLGGGR
ncbi:MAG: 2-hydroxyacyl-CoA dehydratase family protein [Peptococcaceae bacterium]|nr:2-hydroxyacyl-CoA dehydratase family protein [Peptococcaceae bacterium]